MVKQKKVSPDYSNSGENRDRQYQERTTRYVTVQDLGEGVAEFLETPDSSNLRTAVTDKTGSGSLLFASGALDTPSSGTLTNCTGLPISTGVSGLGTGVATFLATPSSANLRTAVTDETGSGALVFATSPTLVTPALGTPASGTLTNCTGLPHSALASPQGGTTGEHYHLTSAQSARLTSATNFGMRDVSSDTDGTMYYARTGEVFGIDPSSDGDLLTWNGGIPAATTPGFDITATIQSLLNTNLTPRRLTATFDTTEVTTSTTETNLLNYTVTGGTLGATGGLRIRISGTITNNTGSGVTYTIRVYWAGTKYFDSAVSMATSTISRAFQIDVHVQNLNSASKQAISGLFFCTSTGMRDATGLGNIGAASEYAAPFAGGSGSPSTAKAYPTANTASNQDIRVSIQMGTSNASAKFKNDHAEVMYQP